MSTSTRLPQEAPSGADALMAGFVRLPKVMQITGLGRTTIYRMIAEARFPRPVRLSQRAVAWRSEDLVAWRASLRPVRH